MYKGNNDLSDLEKILLKFPGLVTSHSKNKEITLQGPVKIKVRVHRFSQNTRKQ